jgi:hypothetical protein
MSGAQAGRLCLRRTTVGQASRLSQALWGEGGGVRFSLEFILNNITL